MLIDQEGRRWTHGVLGVSVWIALAFLAGSLTRVARAERSDAAPEVPSDGIEFFESKIRPILVDHCYDCHAAGAEKIRGDLLLDSKAGWQKGGASGKPILIPGDPEGSLLIQAVRHAGAELSMPPKDKLSETQIADLAAWIRMGAPDPREGGTTLPDPG
jgi:mono/diheme cytochrome c family protein